LLNSRVVDPGSTLIHVGAYDPKQTIIGWLCSFLMYDDYVSRIRHS